MYVISKPTIVAGCTSIFLSKVQSFAAVCLRQKHILTTCVHKLKSLIAGVDGLPPFSLPYDTRVVANV